MRLQDAFEWFGKLHPDQGKAASGTQMALRRGGIKTVEQLRDVCENRPQELRAMRDIGPRRMELIRAFLRFWKAHGAEHHESAEKSAAMITHLPVH